MTHPTRIAVTGASGFVGSALSLFLARQGHAVVALHRSAPSGATHSGIEHRQVDYSSDASLQQALRGCHQVIHLIAKTHAPDTPQALDAYRLINVDITRNLIRASQHAGVQRFVYLSSIKAVAESSREPLTHLTSAAPSTAYGISKREAELLVESTCQNTGMEWCIVRCPLIYAPHAKGNIASLSRALQKNLPLPLGAIHNRRSIVELDLLCEILSACCSAPGANGQILMAANPLPLSTPALIQRLADDTQQKARLIHIPTSLLKVLARLTGKQQSMEKLLGNLELNAEHTWQQLNITPPNQIPS